MVSERAGQLMVSEPLVTHSGYGERQLKRYTWFTARTGGERGGAEKTQLLPA